MTGERTSSRAARGGNRRGAIAPRLLVALSPLLAGSTASTAASAEGQPRAEAREAIAVIAHPTVAAADLPLSHLAAIFLRKKRSWPDGKQILVFSAPARTATRLAFDQQSLGISSNQSADYWIDYRIRGYGRPPRSVRSPRLLLRLVSRLSGAVAYVPVSALTEAHSTVKVLRVDGRSPGSEGYPLHLPRGGTPARPAR